MQSGSAASSHPLYKTKLCSHWQRGFCLYGSMCQFAHGEQELRQVQKHRTGRHHHHHGAESVASVSSAGSGSVMTAPGMALSHVPVGDPRSRLSFDELAARRSALAAMEPSFSPMNYEAPGFSPAGVLSSAAGAVPSAAAAAGVANEGLSVFGDAAVRHRQAEEPRPRVSLDARLAAYHGAERERVLAASLAADRASVTASSAALDDSRRMSFDEHPQPRVSFSADLAATSITSPPGLLAASLWGPPIDASAAASPNAVVLSGSGPIGGTDSALDVVTSVAAAVADSTLPGDTDSDPRLGWYGVDGLDGEGGRSPRKLVSPPVAGDNPAVADEIHRLISELQTGSTSLDLTTAVVTELDQVARSIESVPSCRDVSELLAKAIINPAAAVAQCQQFNEVHGTDDTWKAQYMQLQEALADYRTQLESERPTSAAAYGHLMRAYDELSRSVKSRHSMLRAAAQQLEQVLQDQARVPELLSRDGEPDGTDPSLSPPERAFVASTGALLRRRAVVQALLAALSDEDTRLSAEITQAVLGFNEQRAAAGLPTLALDAVLASDSVALPSSSVVLTPATKDLVVQCARDVQRLVCDCRAEVAASIQGMVKHHQTAAALVAHVVTERVDMKRARLQQREQETAALRQQLAAAVRDSNMLLVTQLQRAVDEQAVQSEADRAELSSLLVAQTVLQTDTTATHAELRRASKPPTPPPRLLVREGVIAAAAAAVAAAAVADVSGSGGGSAAEAESRVAGSVAPSTSTRP